MMRMVGIYREPECSPGRHLSNDALLLEDLGRVLGARGVEVTLLTFDDAMARRPEASLVFSMCQGPRALAALLDWERAGARIVNSPASALNTHRDHLLKLMLDAGVPFPETRLIDTAADEWQTLSLQGPQWLKRGDVHASVAGDVQRVDSREALRDGLADFVQRGIPHAAVQQHCAGAEIKFYGVAGGSFFHWFFTNQADEPSPDTAALQRLGERAALAAGLDIYGGDIIVGPRGELTLIDLNDWPSFAPCRGAASEAIADSLMRRVDVTWHRSLVPSANESAV